ncbi:MAG TPA: hypothetical protein VG308_14240, partial [Stellaceae bacterium]|nr:hypothetical protein [Stellaceae bacterium]
MQLIEPTETTLRPQVRFADALPEFVSPPITIDGDVDSACFRQRMVLEVPKLLYLLERPRSEGAITHLVVDVTSSYFASHHDCECEVSLELDGTPVGGTRLFHKWYSRHQFLVPVAECRYQSQLLQATA